MIDQDHKSGVRPNGKLHRMVAGQYREFVGR